MDEEWTSVFDDKDGAPVYLRTYEALTRVLPAQADKVRTKILDLYGIAISQPSAVNRHVFAVRHRLAICFLCNT